MAKDSGVMLGCNNYGGGAYEEEQENMEVVLLSWSHFASGLQYVDACSTAYNIYL